MGKRSLVYFSGWSDLNIREEKPLRLALLSSTSLWKLGVIFPSTFIRLGGFILPTNLGGVGWLDLFLLNLGLCCSRWSYITRSGPYSMASRKVSTIFMVSWSIITLWQAHFFSSWRDGARSSWTVWSLGASYERCPFWRIRPDFWRTSSLEEGELSGVRDIPGSVVPLPHLWPNNLLNNLLEE